ncbi:MAG: leucine-rich repeat domain-containing protein, partial [Oscillospiraceae bacterium]|nr:leucine-rich repeat domain-containing protein [Oscillospiraceae bacterium]
AYYPYDNENWTSSDFADYGGTLTWDYYSLAGTLAEGICGTGVNWSLDQAGTLFITGTGEMDAYSTSNGITTAPWGVYADQITRVIVGNGVTMMGQFAFYGLEGLTGISFWGDRPEFAAYAFSGVNTTVDYKANNTTWIPSELGKYGGNILWKPSEMSEGYIAYSSLTSTSSYWRLDHQGTLTLYNYSGSYSIGGAPWYDYRYHIKKVVVKGYEDVSQYAFYNCTELTELVIEGSTDGIGTSAFENCTKLKKVNLGSYMISIGNYAFSGCTSLESIYVQPYPNLKIGNYAFYCCTGLKEVSIPGNVTLGTQAFGSCSKLNTIYINENCYGGNFSAQSNTFSGVTANVYYPEGSWSYSSTRNQNYGGTLSWMSVYFGSCGIDAKWNYNVDTKELTIT